ncbi:MAG: hypothetical protein NVSMB66_0400 [Candidatus Doudnabacteria bacterium]
MAGIPIPNTVRVFGLPSYAELDEAKRKEHSHKVVALLKEKFPGAQNPKSSPKTGLAIISFPDEDAFQKALKLDRETLPFEGSEYKIRVHHLHKTDKPKGETMSANHSNDPKKKETEKVGAEAEKVGLKGLKHAIEEGIEGIAGFGIGEVLLLGAKKFLVHPKTIDAAQTAGKKISETLAKNLSRKENHDYWLLVLEKMQPANRLKLTRWLGNPDLVDRGFYDNFVECFIDHINRDTPTNSTELDKLFRAKVEAAAALLDDFISTPTGVGPAADQERLTRARGMCGYKPHSPGSSVKRFGNIFMEMRRQANHAIDPDHPDFQPRAHHRHHTTSTATSTDQPKRLI